MFFNDLPRHLILGGNRKFYFRISVPKKLRSIVGKTEIKRALKTSDETLARKLAISYALQYEIFFAELKLSPNPLPQVAPLIAPPILPTNKANPRHMLNLLMNSFTVDIKTNADGSKETRVHLDPDKPEAEKVLYEAFVQSGGFDKLSAAIASAAPPPPSASNAVPAIVAAPVTQQTSSPPPANEQDDASPQPSLTISEAIDAFIADNLENWSLSTQTLYKSNLNVLREIVGSRPLNKFKRSDSKRVKKILEYWPVNRTKLEYKDLTTEQLIKRIESVPEEQRLARRTFNGYMTLFRAFFAWAELEYEVKPGCFVGFRRKSDPNSDNSENREPFTKEDLTKIFSHEIFTAPIRKKPYQYWLPLLALFTGARLEEMAGLHRSDIAAHDGICSIEINPKNGCRLKNKSSIRNLPIHPDLLDLGFLDFVASRPTRLFPELKIKKATGKCGDTASDWFARFRKRLGITGSQKVFHSYRHTFTDELRERDIDDSKTGKILGHASDHEITAGYGKRPSGAKFFPTIQNIDFSGVLKNVKKW